jgi:hypothetical protein
MTKRIFFSLLFSLLFSSFLSYKTSQPSLRISTIVFSNANKPDFVPPKSKKFTISEGFLDFSKKLSSDTTSNRLPNNQKKLSIIKGSDSVNNHVNIALSNIKTWENLDQLINQQKNNLKYLQKDQFVTFCNLLVELQVDSRINKLPSFLYIEIEDLLIRHLSTLTIVETTSIFTSFAKLNFQFFKLKISTQRILLKHLHFLLSYPMPITLMMRLILSLFDLQFTFDNKYLSLTSILLDKIGIQLKAFLDQSQSSSLSSSSQQQLPKLIINTQELKLCYQFLSKMISLKISSSTSTSTSTSLILFSPLTQQLFLLLLIQCLEYSQQISSLSMFQQTIWMLSKLTPLDTPIITTTTTTTTTTSNNHNNNGGNLIISNEIFLSIIYNSLLYFLPRIPTAQQFLKIFR